VRTDEQHAALAVTQARIGVQEIGGSVQGDDGLTRPRTAVDDERTARSRADDGSWSAAMVPSTSRIRGRPAAATAGDEGGLVVERGVPFQPVRGEHLVPVVADRPRVQRYLRRLARPIGLAWVAPKNGSAAGERQSSSSRRPALVREAEPTDVHGLGGVCADHASEAQVQAKRRRTRRRAGQPVDLHVPVHRGLADATGRPALEIEAVGQVGDRLSRLSAMATKCCSSSAINAGSALAARRSGRSNAAGSQEIHVISSDPPRDPAGRQQHTHFAPRFP